MCKHCQSGFDDPGPVPAEHPIRTVPVSGFGERVWDVNQELAAENAVLLERVAALQHEVTRLERHNGILEQRLRRIGDAVLEGRVVDGS